MIDEEKLNLLIEAMLENQPRKTSTRFDTGSGLQTVSAGTILTITYAVDLHQYVIRLLEAYADTRTGLTYEWIINGAVVTVNPQWQPPYGVWLQADVKVRITNATAADIDLWSYVRGWGDAKSGG